MVRLGNYMKATKRRLEIKEAALDLFSKKGFRATTMEQIASSVRIARVTLYDYYKSKEDIFYSLVDDIVEEPRTEVLGGTVKKQLETLAKESIARLLNNFTVYRILFQEMPSLEKATAEKLKAWQERSMSLVLKVIDLGFAEGLFSSRFRREDIAFSFRALIGQRLADILLMGSVVEPELEAKRLVDLLWFGVGGAR
jgi:AcrR family transcriptional regulator